MPIATVFVNNPTSPEQAAERIAAKAAAQAAEAARPRPEGGCLVCKVDTNGQLRCAVCGAGPWCCASHGVAARANHVRTAHTPGGADR